MCVCVHIQGLQQAQWDGKMKKCSSEHLQGDVSTGFNMQPMHQHSISKIVK